MEIDASIIDVSTELINKTPIKKKPIPLSPRSTSQDVMGIVTEKKGRVNAATSNSLNMAPLLFVLLRSVAAYVGHPSKCLELNLSAYFTDVNKLVKIARISRSSFLKVWYKE